MDLVDARVAYSEMAIILWDWVYDCVKDRVKAGEVFVKPLAKNMWHNLLLYQIYSAHKLYEISLDLYDHTSL